jgi:putative transcriptional regulator
MQGFCVGRRITMAVSYDRLWKLLIDKKMSVADLRKAAEIAPNTMTRMRKDQEVTMSVLEKICDVLHADFGDIIEYKKLYELQKVEEQYSAKR